MRARRAHLVVASAALVVGCREPSPLPAPDAGRAASTTSAASPTTSAASTSGVGSGAFALARRTATSPEGIRTVMLSGLVPSFDGLPLAVDVTLPDDGAVGPRPLVVFLHGWGADKGNWETAGVEDADAAHSRWNNVAFAARGYAVVNATARGFRESCGPGRAQSKYLQNTLVPECRTRPYWVHVADPRVEVRDAQTLVGFLVDEGIADPARVGVTGGSYGGAQAWQLALLRDRTTAPDGTLVPWTSPRGAPISVAVAAPFYTWASLVGALVPNGRGVDGSPPSAATLRAPVGVPLGTYLTGFFAGGPATATAFYAPPTADPSADFTAWFARLTAGPPFVDDRGVDPVLHRALDELERRAPLHAEPHGLVPVYQVQGTTDPLFPAIHAVQMRAKLLAADPRWPITSFFADVGHDNARNDRDAWDRAHAEAASLFDAVLLGRGSRPAPRVTLATTTCEAGRSPRYLVADTWAALAPARRTFASSESRTTTSASVARASLVVDPLVGGAGCRRIPAGQEAGAHWTFPVGGAITLAGQPAVRLEARFVGTDAALALRLWDVAPSGESTLISRGVYRWVAPSRLSPELGRQTIVTHMSANGWDLAAGHSVRLEVLGNAAPELQASALPFGVTIDRVELSLPTTGP